MPTRPTLVTAPADTYVYFCKYIVILKTLSQYFSESMHMWVTSTLVIIDVNPAVLARLYAAAVTHVTLLDVLHDLHNVISATQQRESCISSLLLSSTPASAQRGMAKSGG